MSEEQIAALTKQVQDLTVIVKNVADQQKQQPLAKAPLQIEERPGQPIPFRPDDVSKFASTVDATGSPPTGLRDCMKKGGHGGDDGTRFYYGQATYNHSTGDFVKGPRICEICGTVGI